MRLKVKLGLSDDFGAGGAGNVPLGTIEFDPLHPMGSYDREATTPLGEIEFDAFSITSARVSNVPMGVVEFDAFDPSGSTTQAVVVPLGEIEFDGFAPSGVQNISGATPLGVVEFDGFAPTSTQGQAANIPLGTIEFDGFSPGVARGSNVPLGEFEFDGIAPSGATGGGGAFAPSDLASCLFEVDFDGLTTTGSTYSGTVTNNGSLGGTLSAISGNGPTYDEDGSGRGYLESVINDLTDRMTSTATFDFDPTTEILYYFVAATIPTARFATILGMGPTGSAGNLAVTYEGARGGTLYVSDGTTGSLYHSSYETTGVAHVADARVTDGDIEWFYNGTSQTTSTLSLTEEMTSQDLWVFGRENGGGSEVPDAKVFRFAILKTATGSPLSTSEIDDLRDWCAAGNGASL